MQQAPPQTVCATFAGIIDNQSLGRIFQNFAGASQGGVTEVHLLFQSLGCSIPDGISLYRFFDTLPLTLHIYNTGSVQSVAVLAYVGVDRVPAWEWTRTLPTSQCRFIRCSDRPHATLVCQPIEEQVKGGGCVECDELTYNKSSHYSDAQGSPNFTSIAEAQRQWQSSDNGRGGCHENWTNRRRPATISISRRCAALNHYDDGTGRYAC